MWPDVRFFGGLRNCLYSLADPGLHCLYALFGTEGTAKESYYRVASHLSELFGAPDRKSGELANDSMFGGLDDLSWSISSVNVSLHVYETMAVWTVLNIEKVSG